MLLLLLQFYTNFWFNQLMLVVYFWGGQHILSIRELFVVAIRRSLDSDLLFMLHGQIAFIANLFLPLAWEYNNYVLNLCTLLVH